MRVKTYYRIAQRKGLKPLVDARATPTAAPLKDGSTPLPTVAFAIELVIPDAMFKQAEQVIATLTIPESAVQIAAEVDEIKPASSSYTESEKDGDDA